MKVLFIANLYRRVQRSMRVQRVKVSKITITFPKPGDSLLICLLRFGDNEMNKTNIWHVR